MKAHAKPLPSGLFATIFFTLLFILVVTASRAQGQLVMTGKVLTAESTELRANAEIIASDGTRMPLDIRPNGRFWVCAPADDLYTLRFAQAGTITKEIVVDGRKACDAGNHHDRNVKFDVLLFADASDQAMRFSAPVGMIGFCSKGDVHVSHHYEMVPVSSLMALEE